MLSRVNPAGGDVEGTKERISKVEREMALWKEEIEKVGEKIEAKETDISETMQEIKDHASQGRDIPEYLTLHVQSLREEKAKLWEKKHQMWDKKLQLWDVKKLVEEKKQLVEEKKQVVDKNAKLVEEKKQVVDKNAKLVEELNRMKAKAAGEAYLPPEVLSRSGPSPWRTWHGSQVIGNARKFMKCTTWAL